MAFLQATRRVLAPASMARTFTSLGPREMQQTARMTPSLGLTFSQKQSKLDLPQEQAMKDVQDHWKKSSGVQSKVPMAEIDTLTSLPNDLRITFSTVADLEKYVQLCKAEGGHSKEEVLNLFEHFINGVDGRNATLDVSTWTFNYGENAPEELNAKVAKKVTVGEARQQKKSLNIGGQVARKVYAEKLFSAIGGNFARK